MCMLSVVVPVYNVERKYLEECLYSIKNQTFKDYELVIIDDGADESTRSFLDEYAAKEENVVVIHQKNKGVAAARNAALEIIKGEYVTFVDSDDTIREDNFESAIIRAEKNNLDILFWGMKLRFPSKEVDFSPYLEDIELFDAKRKREVVLKCLVGILPSFKAPASKDAAGSACAKLYRKQFLDENSLRYTEGLKRAEDMFFNLQAFNCASNIGYVYDFYYNYRQLATSATYQYRPNGIEVFTDTLKQMRRYLDRVGADDELMQVYYMRCMFFLLESMDMDYNNPQNPAGFLERRRQLSKVALMEPYKEAIAGLRLMNKDLVVSRKLPLVLIRFKLFGLLMLFYKVYGMLSKR